MEIGNTITLRGSQLPVFPGEFEIFSEQKFYWTPANGCFWRFDVLIWFTMLDETQPIRNHPINEEFEQKMHIF